MNPKQAGWATTVNVSESNHSRVAAEERKEEERKGKERREAGGQMRNTEGEEN